MSEFKETATIELSSYLRLKDIERVFVNTDSEKEYCYIPNLKSVGYLLVNPTDINKELVNRNEKMSNIILSIQKAFFGDEKTRDFYNNPEYGINEIIEKLSSKNNFFKK